MLKVQLGPLCSPENCVCISEIKSSRLPFFIPYSSLHSVGRKPRKQHPEASEKVAVNFVPVRWCLWCPVAPWWQAGFGWLLCRLQMWKHNQGCRLVRIYLRCWKTSTAPRIFQTKPFFHRTIHHKGFTPIRAQDWWSVMNLAATWIPLVYISAHPFFFPLSQLCSETLFSEWEETATGYQQLGNKYNN